MPKVIYSKYVNDVKELYLTKNLNITEISKELNISTSTIYRILVRYSIKKPKDLAHTRRVNVYKSYNYDYWQKRNSKSRKTLQEKYGDGIINASQIPGIQEKTHSPSSIEKSYKTKKKNNSFNSSEPEDKIFSKLSDKFGNVERNYKSDEYPFKCDFYIPKLNLYIEYQGSWTHGFDCHKLVGPFINSIECKKLLNKWIKKSEKSKFYVNAINTWTIRDPKKRKIAKENNLNWMEFFTFNEFIDWFEKQ